MDIRIPLLLIILAPLCGIILLGIVQLMNQNPGEKLVRRITGLSSLISFFLSLYCLIFACARERYVSQPFHFLWYKIGHHDFEISILGNQPNLLVVFVFVFICNIVGFFSSTYLHREKSFFRYHLVYLGFCFSITISALASNIDTLFIGWELVALSSVLLIAFYNERKSPSKNSLFTLCYYRMGEAFLIAALILIHLDVPSMQFTQAKSVISAAHTEYIIMLIFLAAMIKSAQWPFSSWLPRAMEGPTPSSAVFYGGIATHLGPLLLIKTYDIWSSFPWATYLLFSIGLVSAFLSSGTGRTRPDVKTQLAYATTAQIGIIFAEISLGITKVALAHILLHCTLRTFQFLKSPSALHDYLYFDVSRSNFYLENLIPRSLRISIFRLTISEYGVSFLISKILLIFFNAVSLIRYIENRLERTESNKVIYRSNYIHNEDKNEFTRSSSVSYERNIAVNTKL